MGGSRAIGGFYPSVRSMLGFRRGLVAVTDEGTADVAGHGYIDVSFHVMPIEVQAAVEFA